MKPTFTFILIASLTLGLFGCKTNRVEDVYIPDTGPVLEALNANEATVLGKIEGIADASDSIVKVTKGTAYEAPAAAAGATIQNAITDIRASIAANPAAKMEKVVKQLLDAIEQLKAIIVTLQRENQELRDANAKRWYWVLSGLGVACTLGAVASGFFSGSIPVIGPMLGPRIGVLLGSLAGTCFLLVYLFNWARNHPTHVAVIVVGLLGTAAGLAWHNHITDREEKAAKS
jgi:hypothetical protein